MDNYDPAQREYYWKEMYYNSDIRDNDECLDIYDDMEWWYLYQLGKEEEYEEQRKISRVNR